MNLFMTKKFMSKDKSKVKQKLQLDKPSEQT